MIQVVTSVVCSSQDELGQLRLSREYRKFAPVVDTGNPGIAESSISNMYASLNAILCLDVEILEFSLREQDICFIHCVLDEKLSGTIHSSSVAVRLGHSQDDRLGLIRYH